MLCQYEVPKKNYIFSFAPPQVCEWTIKYYQNVKLHFVLICYNTHKESCEVQREEEVMSKLRLWNDAFKICNEAMQGHDKSLGFLAAMLTQIDCMGAMALMKQEIIKNEMGSFMKSNWSI